MGDERHIIGETEHGDRVFGLPAEPHLCPHGKRSFCGPCEVAIDRAVADRDAELRRLQAIALAAAEVSDEFGDDITERDAPLAFAKLKALREALDVAPGLPCARIDVHDHEGVPCVTSGCRRCSECRGENHHWLEESRPPPPNGDGFNGYVCKHCDAIAEMCDDCTGAVEPGHVCEDDEGGDLEDQLDRAVAAGDAEDAAATFPNGMRIRVIDAEHDRFGCAGRIAPVTSTSRPGCLGVWLDDHNGVGFDAPTTFFEPSSLAPEKSDLARTAALVGGLADAVADDCLDECEDDSEHATRKSIARYLDHCSRTDIGAISLDGLFDTKQMMAVCASWVRNRLDVKWATELEANTPPASPTEPEGAAQDEDCRVRPCACPCHTDVEDPGPHLLTCAWAKDSYVPREKGSSR